MKTRLILSAVGVIAAAIAAIVAVLQTSPESPKVPDPSPIQFEQPQIGKDPTAYGPVFKPNRPNCGPDGCK